MAGDDNLPAPVGDVVALDAELADLRALQTADAQAYWKPATQAAVKELMARKMSPEGKGARAVAAIHDALDAEDWHALSGSFDGLSPTVHGIIRNELASEAPPVPRPVGQDGLRNFASTPEGHALVVEWGRDAGHKLAVLRERIAAISSRLTNADRDALSYWFNAISSEEAKAIERALAG